MLRGTPCIALEVVIHCRKNGSDGSIARPRFVSVVLMDDSGVASDVWSNTVTRTNPLNSKALSRVQYRLKSSMGIRFEHEQICSPVADVTRADTNFELWKKFRPVTRIRMGCDRGKMEGCTFKTCGK